MYPLALICLWLFSLALAPTTAHSQSITFVENSGICETTPGVGQASGYVSITPVDRMWFWFFEARHAPTEAPLTLWLNGGPGCSSMIGLFQEIGPCTVNDDRVSTTLNPYSWTEVSNVLFLDQPILSGFSLGPGVVRTTEKAAEDVWTFMQAFLSDEKFVWLQEREFFIATESFGGRYGPVFTNYFLAQNARIDKGEILGVKIPVKGLAISNGKHDPLTQMQSAIEFSRDAPGYGPIVNKTVITAITRSWERKCKPALEKCYSENVNSQCRQAMLDCTAGVLNPSSGTRDSSDLLQQEDAPHFPPTSYLRYIRSQGVMDAIGANTRYDQCNHTVKARFAGAGETGRSYLPPLAKLANAKFPILIWAGDTDVKCNWLGVHDSMIAMDWYGNQELKGLKFRNLTIENAAVGTYKIVDNFSFVRVFRAGHAMPAFQPKVALEIFSQFISQNQTLHSV